MFIFHPDVKDDPQLKLPEKAIYTAFYTRMKSSFGQPIYFDKKFSQYYVVATREEIGSDCGVSVSTVSRYTKHLEQLGYIVVRRVKHEANRYFLPRYKHVYIKPAKPVVTQDVALCDSRSSERTTALDTVPAVKPLNAMDQWKLATMEKLALSQNAVDVIAKFSKNVEEAKSIVKYVLIARGQVALDNKLTKDDPVTRFETNDNIIHRLGTKLLAVLSFAKSNHVKKIAGYLIKSLKTFFTEAFGIKQDEPAHVAPKAPRSSSKKHVKETLPDWARDDYKPKPKKPLTQADKDSFAEQMARINALPTI